ncbi:SGNH/GDSL hydrolase family protein [Aporhodopirellula aestuarii]|uniref:SGNH/GDSL hydrolase family protein n=1 Tax=Aporhodopirellula aestuarii TaxID=2950107 RepID=A0ABT0U310_9BACT|nr:SGNH/GDSL hydrolase family protein [Aporhodopirellula aestuarii]MCM2371281.1 SGNH/GDSL hydrolase family protein [Aporhodopirellula aestuarii]
MIRTYLIAPIVCCVLATSVLRADSPIRPGDRVAVVGNTFADQLRIHGYLETLLLQHTTDQPISIRNLGWGGDMLTARDRPTNFPSEASTLTAHRTDVIVACFGMGESFAGEAGIDKFKTDLRNFIESHRGQKYNGKSVVRLVLVSPIAYEDLGDLTPHRENRNRDLESYTQAMQEVAESENVPFVDLFESSRYLMDEREGPNLTNNGILLDEYGYWAISQSFFDQLFTAASDNQPWQIRVDVADQTASGIGVEVADLSVDDSVVAFSIKENIAPRLPPPTDQTLPPQLEFARDTMSVENLGSGSYELTVDGTPVVTATAEQWAKGVAIDSSPAHQEAEALRAMVNDKNLQFTYSWKALNQVHIVGERRSSPSGRALPGEVIQFNELANEIDKNLVHQVKHATRKWRLTRTSK